MADVVKCIFSCVFFCIVIKILLRFVRRGQVDNKSTLVQVMTCRRICNKPLPEPMLTKFHDAAWRHRATMKWGVPIQCWNSTFVHKLRSVTKPCSPMELLWLLINFYFTCLISLVSSIFDCFDDIRITANAYRWLNAKETNCLVSPLAPFIIMV